ncbi:MAG: di-trans,poly-cis-decaprenylcistransferase [Aquificota bacterium]|nr:MAG: di-trans,poly-cis-decaprenylcistransferase [Aquificota bacterium]
MSIKVPTHLAVIMDGNGRWARERGLLRIAGHYAGVKRAEELVDHCIELGIRYLTLFVFSTENWKRPQAEVKGLFKLLEDYLKNRWEELIKKGIKARFIGRRDRIPKGLLREVQRVEALEPKEERLRVFLALDYGGRDEALRVFQRAVERGIKVLDEETFKSLSDLWDAPEPDLLIRTGGERRISNFLLWHLAYTELYFTHVLWPDFDREELIKALEDYSRRVRKFGAVVEK